MIRTILVILVGAILGACQGTSPPTADPACAPYLLLVEAVGKREAVRTALAARDLVLLEEISREIGDLGDRVTFGHAGLGFDEVALDVHIAGSMLRIDVQAETQGLGGTGGEIGMGQSGAALRSLDRAAAALEAARIGTEPAGDRCRQP